MNRLDINTIFLNILKCSFNDDAKLLAFFLGYTTCETAAKRMKRPERAYVSGQRVSLYVPVYPSCYLTPLTTWLHFN